MTRDILKENLEPKMEAAFHPFGCSVEFEDHKNKIGFRVFDEENQTIYNSPSIPIQEAQTSKKLIALLSRARSDIETQGHILEPWDFQS